MRQEGQPCKVDSRVPDSASRSSDWIRVIVGVRVCVERHKLMQEGWPKAKVEVALAVSRVVAVAVRGGAVANVASGGVEAEDVGLEAVQRDRVRFAPEDRPAGEADLKVVPKVEA